MGFNFWEKTDEISLKKVSLAKQEAAEMGVPDLGWGGFLQRSTELYAEVAKRRDDHAKKMRLYVFFRYFSRVNRGRNRP